MTMNAISVEQTGKPIFLHRGKTIALSGNGIGLEITDTNVIKIDEIVNKKNKEFKKYNVSDEVLEFNEKTFTLKANDYFGFIELFGKIIKSDGDYFLE
jgi:hypothetical protein